jgi:hypothetical protein
MTDIGATSRTLARTQHVTHTTRASDHERCEMVRTSAVDLNRLVAPLSILVALVLFGSAAGAVGGGTEAFRSMFLQGICGPLLSVLLHRHIWTPLQVVLTAGAVAVLLLHVRFGAGWTLCASIMVAVGWPLFGWSAGG